MNAEFTLDLCFICVCIKEQKFADLLANELKSLFGGIGNWTVEEKRDKGLDITLVEVNGIWSWQTEAMVVVYLEQKASPQFWEWLQGFQVKIELKQEATQNFCHLKPKAAITRKGEN